MTERQDGFSAERRRLFLAALRMGESVLGACALVGVSNRTAYNHRRSDPAFARDWALARTACRLPLELVAWQRGVIGVEEPVRAYGRTVGTRRRYSDGLLRALLAGEDPGKYGRGSGLRADREGLERRIDNRIAAAIEPLVDLLEAALDARQSMRTLRNNAGAPVNFVNPVRASHAASARRQRRRNWRLTAARRRRAQAGISCFPGSS